MRLEEVHFNHAVNSASSDAIDIRKDAGGTAIQAPEWNDGLPPQPAAYASAALGDQVTIRAKFSGGPPNHHRKIRAIDAWLPSPSPGGCLGWLLQFISNLLRALFGNVLGDTEEKSVSFDGAGNTALVTFALVNHKLKTSGVGIRTTDWKWQYHHHGHWIDFAASQHKIYVVLDIPNGPWQQNPAGNNTQLPWIDALDKACLWALGAKTKDDAAERITKAINTHSLQSYTPATMFGFSDYYLTSYLTHLNSGNTFVLNCTDCADAVTTFSNLLGCNLWEGRFFNMVTRKFLTLKGNPAVEADWVSWGWGYHEICWLNAIGQTELVYDGCLQLDIDNSDSDFVHIAQHPIKMRFGLTSWNGGAPTDYLYRLLQSGVGNLENIPRRRSVT
jgi:hypothetical protein